MMLVNWKGFGRQMKQFRSYPDIRLRDLTDTTTRITHEMKCCGQDSNLALFVLAVSFTVGSNMLHFTVVKVYNMGKILFTEGIEMYLCSEFTPSCDIAFVTGVKYKALYKFA
jgi:hypothetical protein